MQNAKVLTKTTWWKSEESINLESCYNIFDENVPEPENHKQPNKTENKVLDETFHFEDKFHKDLNITNLPWYKRILYQMIEMFGLDIFMDLRYVNIMIGNCYYTRWIKKVIGDFFFRCLYSDFSWNEFHRIITVFAVRIFTNNCRNRVFFVSFRGCGYFIPVFCPSGRGLCPTTSPNFSGFSFRFYYSS